MQHLPPNVKEAIVNVYDSILASFYYPKLLRIIKIIFLGKNEKDTSNPLNFRPISLIEIIGKIFEKILNARFIHYIEHHNLLTELQFGFRKYRSTEHVITMLHETFKENTNQRLITATATRDISKAFDTILYG